jgi:ammonium transporter Rh
MRCIVNTVLALLASTTATFYLSHRLTNYKLDPVHIANSTLAGGVAIGASARLDIGPGGALVLGALAGVVSVFGYIYATPFLQDRLSIYDTCGVGNLHGLPSILGGLASLVFVALDPSADFSRVLGRIANCQANRWNRHDTGCFHRLWVCHRKVYWYVR